MAWLISSELYNQVFQSCSLRLQVLENLSRGEVRLQVVYHLSCNNVLEKFTRFWLAENECILIKHERKLRITRAHFQNFAFLGFCDVFSCRLLTCKFFKDFPYGLEQFCCLYKIYSRFLRPNCTRNHVIAYTKLWQFDTEIVLSISNSRKGRLKKKELVAWG